MHRRHGSRGRAGFTMVEIILATALILFGIYAVVKVNPLGYRGAILSRDHVTALRLARSVIEEARARPFGAPLDSLQGTYTAAGDKVEGKASEGGFTISRVTPIGVTDTSRAGYVEVVVSWREGTGAGSVGVDKNLTLRGGIVRVP